MSVMKENNRERLNFDVGNKDDSGELANLLVVLCNVQGLCTVKEGKIWSVRAMHRRISRVAIGGRAEGQSW